MMLRMGLFVMYSVECRVCAGAIVNLLVHLHTALYKAEMLRHYQIGMGDNNGMQLAFNLFLPKTKKPRQHRKFWCQI